MIFVSDPSKREAARGWVLELANGQIDAQQRAEFDRWLAADAEHASAYKQALRIYQAAGDVGQVPQTEPARTNRAPHPAPSQVLYPGVLSRIAAPRVWGSTLAACLALAAAFVLFPRGDLTTAPAIYVTEQAQAKHVVMADGSNVAIGADTQLSVVMEPDLRHVTLSKGQAYFEVERDTSRPFEVETPFATVRVLGTAFDVNVTSDNTIVVVTHGIVEVTEKLSPGSLAKGRSYRLTAGDELRTEASGEGQISVSNLGGEPLSWRDGFLSYDDAPLAEVVADANRYSARRIRLSDPALGKLRVTGSYPIEQLDQMLTNLDRALPVEVERGPDLILFKPEPDAGN